MEFLVRLGMRSLSHFETCQINHHAQLDENGWIASAEFVYTTGS